MAAARLSRWLDGLAERHGALQAQAAPDQVVVSATDGTTAWLTVPFPPLVVSGGPLAALQAHVARQRRVGVLLVRRGGYAAGVFDGDRLASSKVGSAYVQGGTKAGGWSQQRFARRRANQARAAFAEAADAAARILPGAGIEALVCGGDRAAVATVLADPRLAPLAPLRTGPLLAVPDPRLRVLQETPGQFLTVAVALHESG